MLFNLNIENLEKFIIDNINRDIPNQFKNNSIITGGYILGLFMEFMGLSERKNSDIDIFTIIDPFSGELTEHLGKDFYAFYFKTKGFSIHEEFKKNNLNIIKIIPTHEFKWDDIIDSFDLNCVKAGVYFKDGKFNFIWSEKFIRFINDNNKEIKISNRVFNYLSQSELRSFARSLEKKEQYPFFSFKLNENFNNAILLMTKKMKSREHSLIIGKNKIDTLRKYLKENPYIQINEENKLIINYYTELEDNCLSLFAINFLDSKKKLLMSKAELNRYLIIRKIFPFSFLDGDSSRRIFMKLFSLLENDYSKRDLEILSTFLRHEFGFLRNISSFLKNLAIRERMDFIKKISKDSHLIATLETVQVSPESLKLFSKIKSYDELIFFQKKHIVQKYDWDFRPLSDLFIWNKYITELTNSSMLNKESDKMKHCVKGYFTQIMQGNERIFHLDYKGNSSTFSVKINNKNTYYCSQHKGKNNIEPPKMNKLIVLLFVNYLNKVYPSQKIKILKERKLFVK